MRTASLFVPLVLWCFGALPIGAFPQTNHARDHVNPFVGTGGHGHTFPGACVPNGLVQLSPDTRTDGYMDWDGCGGYHYSDSIIHGFSHTHLSGTGVADLCDVLLMPMSRNPDAQEPGAGRRPWSSTFSHGRESAQAGFYSVHLDGPNVDVELTATARTGVHRYSWPRGGGQVLVLDLLHRDKLIEGGIEMVSSTEIVGERRSSSWAKDQRLFFCLRTSRPFFPSGAGGAHTDITPDTDKRRTQVLLFGASDGTPIVVKVGISAVSIEGARRNLDAEVPGWDFDAVRQQAEDAWNAKLNKIEVSGGTKEQQRIFYTALYHCYVAPYIFNDVDGQYRGMDGEVHKADHKVYTVFSLWDTFRALHPLMTILEPDMTNDFIKTFLLHYQQGGKLPVWELWGNETNCMIGYHSVSVIADAYMKGIRGYDVDLALEAMMASAMRDEPGLNAYRKKGYISSEDESDDVSKTLEYAYDDGCIWRMMLKMNTSDTALDGMSARMRNFESLFDPSTDFFRARRNGGFIPGFDPFEVNFHYTEANAWQYSVFAPQDLELLVHHHGGEDAFEAHLDKLFSVSSSTSGRDQADITGLIGQYAQGNEPSHHMAYLYNRLGRPDKTRALVKRIMDEFYHDSPDGLIGNEDCGQMSAWYVLSALGFYPISPGIDRSYRLGYPLFDKSLIHLAEGRSWTMNVDLNDSQNAEVPADTSYFKSHIPYFLWHDGLMNGGSMTFNPDRSHDRVYVRQDITVLDGAYVWENCRRPGAPIIQARNAVFMDTMTVTILGCDSGVVTDDQGTRLMPPNKPFVIDRSCQVTVDWDNTYEPVVARFTKVDGNRTVKLESTYANQYAAGGENALVDGLRGGRDFRTGEWQGYQGQDLLATVDLGSVKKLKRAGLSVLQDQGSWIWFPASVNFAWSTNGRTWSSRTVENSVDRKADGGMVSEMWTEVLDKKARYLKITATNAGPCPDWHPGKGGATWIFADEILIETE